jgi:hypothetical protein
MINASAIQIEKGVPIPGARSAGGLTVLVRAMEIGDSFEIAKSYRQSVFNIFRREKFKVKTRDIGGNKIRAWRIA